MTADTLTRQALAPIEKFFHDVRSSLLPHTKSVPNEGTRVSVNLPAERVREAMRAAG